MLARCVVAGQTVLVSRRCDDRRFLLRPDERINQVLLYCLAVFANKYGVLVHQFSAMSNHIHGTYTDTRGVLPDFLRDFGKETALALKHLRPKRGCWWDSDEKPAVQALLTESSILDKMAYGYVNPTAAGLVSDPEQWPGVNLAPEQVGTCIQVERPDFYFKNETKFPERVTLHIAPPPSFDGRVEWLRQAVRNVANEAIAQARAKLRAAGRWFLGVRGVVTTDPYARPGSEERAQAFIPALAARSAEALR
ncbi:MAG: transposase, partial [Proteobacteria bacterium]|nr:transposase [Pseudomonadota bacterium]